MAEEKIIEIIDEEPPDKAVDTHPRDNGRLERYTQITAVATSIIVLAILGLLLYFIRGVVMVFALAFLAAYILSPAVRFFEKRRVHRLLVVILLYVLFVAAVVVGTVLLLPMLWDELKDLQVSIQQSLIDPEFGRGVSARLKAMQDRLTKTFPMLKNTKFGAQLDIDNAMSLAASWILNYIGQSMRAITAYSGKLIWLVIVMILIPFITFFLLKDGKSIKRVVLSIVPSKYSETALELSQKIDRQIGRYIRGRLAESIILSAMTIIGLRVLGIKYYLVIGGVAGFANLIPYIGPVMIGIPPVILAGYQYNLFHMVITGIFLGVLQIVDNAILVPMVVGKSVDLHPVVTIFVVFVGGQLLGFLGMIIAVPLTSILIAMFQAFYKEYKVFSATA
jgi:predicted PurR-regulated permease PerM